MNITAEQFQNQQRKTDKTHILPASTIAVSSSHNGAVKHVRQELDDRPTDRLRRLQ